MSTMAVAILSSLIDGTGNKTTALRICSYLQDEYKVHLCDLKQFHSPGNFEEFTLQNGIQAIIGIHLVRAGRYLLGCRLPYIIIAGGTDLNVATKNEEKTTLMTKIVHNAKYLVVFTESMKKIAANIWPSLSGKIIHQPQGVIATSSDFSFGDLFNQFDRMPLEFEGMKVFLIIGGIRSVKDPLYVAHAISNWHTSDPSIHLVIIGPELDEEYSMKVKDAVKRLPGIYIFPEIHPSDVHSLMTQSVALVNSSVSEGMAGAILEAMYLGTPVIARKNDGNTSLVSDMVNGLLYSTPDEFISKASLLLSDQQLRKKLIEKAKFYIEQKHSNKENESYMMLMRDLISSS